MFGALVQTLNGQCYVTEGVEAFEEDGVFFLKTLLLQMLSDGYAIAIGVSDKLNLGVYLDRQQIGPYGSWPVTYFGVCHLTFP